MPLHQNAEVLIRAGLEKARHGKKPRLVTIGYLTDAQLAEINQHRRDRHLAEIDGKVLFVGKHLYESRIVRDGYTVEDVMLQIENAMSATSKLKISPKMTVLENPNHRLDGYGNAVRDQVVLECSVRFPHPEMYSTIPKGDDVKPRDFAKQKGRIETALLRDSTSLPG